MDNFPMIALALVVVAGILSIIFPRQAKLLFSIAGVACASVLACIVMASLKRSDVEGAIGPVVTPSIPEKIEGEKQVQQQSEQLKQTEATIIVNQSVQETLKSLDNI